MALILGKPGTAEHNKAVLRDPQLRTKGGTTPVPRPSLHIYSVENDLDVVSIPPVYHQLILTLVAHGDHLVLTLVQHPVGQAGHRVVGDHKMIGIDHTDLLVVVFRQHGDIILPKIVAVNEVDIPLPA